MTRRLALLIALLAALGCAVPAAAGARAPAERALYRDGPDGRFLLDSGWTTRPDPRGRGLRERWQVPGRRRGFRRVSVPHAFNARDASRRGFRSRVQWYRMRFDLPRDRRATGWKLRFESVNREARVWLNGRELGRHEGAHLPFELDADGVRARGNELVVRVDGRMSRTDLPPANRPRGWWNHGGILREVYLRRVGAFDVEELRVIPRISALSDPGTGLVAVRGLVRNTSRRGAEPRFSIAWRALPAGGPPGPWQRTADQLEERVRPGRRARIAANLQVPDQRLWSPDEPNLYELRVRVPGGQVWSTRFGMREWGVDAQGRATLNGRPLSLRGASFHEETLNRGAALTPGQRDQLVDELRAIGADVTREHYPPHPALLEAFDRAGIVFWEQIPVWRLRGTQLRSRRVRAEALSRLRRAIERDRNHASVMAWSVANETLRGGSGERAYLRAARRLAKRLDPTRLVAVDTSLRPLFHIPSHYAELDAIGVNEYVGWYGGETPELAGDLAQLRSLFPRTALFVTEFGAEANRDGPASEKGTYLFQRDFLAAHLDAIDRADVSGALVWVLRDFWVRPGWHGGNPQPDAPFNRKGLFDERGVPKPAVPLVRSRFDAVPAQR